MVIPQSDIELFDDNWCQESSTGLNDVNPAVFA